MDKAQELIIEELREVTAVLQKIARALEEANSSEFYSHYNPPPSAEPYKQYWRSATRVNDDVS